MKYNYLCLFIKVYLLKCIIEKNSIFKTSLLFIELQNEWLFWEITIAGDLY